MDCVFDNEQEWINEQLRWSILYKNVEFLGRERLSD